MTNQETKVSYKIVNRYGTPLCSFFLGDMELKEILVYKNSCYLAFPSREKAEEEIKSMDEMARKQVGRWGKELLEKVLSKIHSQTIVHLNY